MLLELPLPADLQGKRVGTPTPFNRLDLTPKDLLALGEFFRAAISRAHAIHSSCGAAHVGFLFCASPESLFRG